MDTRDHAKRAGLPEELLLDRSNGDLAAWVHEQPELFGLRHKPLVDQEALTGADRLPCVVSAPHGLGAAVLHDCEPLIAQLYSYATMQSWPV